MIAFVDNARRDLADEIIRRLKIAQWVFFAVAFIRDSGVDALEAAIRDFVARGGKLSVLFGNAFGITEANAIRRLQILGAELRYHRGADTFHVKGYLFRTAAVTTAIVGSSNLSRSGLISGLEWNVVIESADWDLRPIVDAARQLWESGDSTPVTEPVLAELDCIAPRDHVASHHQDQAPSQATTTAPVSTVEFLFRVNRSFLNYIRRPITIPVQFNTLVRTHALDADHVRIHGPGGQQFDGHIYGSHNNQGEYHQIIVNGDNGDALSRLPRGQEIGVRITGGAQGVEVHLSRPA